MPHAYRPSVHYPRDPGEPKDPLLNADLVFIGTGFKSRVSFFEAMDLDGLDVILGGNWPYLAQDSPLMPLLAHEPDECIPNHETARIYRSAKVGMNLYRREWEEGMTPGEGWAMGPREVEMAACGLPFLRDPRPEGDEVLHMLPRFTSPGEASEQLRWLLAHEAEREELGRQARAAIVDRTFTSNARRLLALVDR
jgi:hypothetical protein